MNEIGSTNSVLDQFRLPSADGRVPEEELGKDAFLELMVAQLEHQDPLSPQENGDFIAQLAQFSSVEGIQNLNTSFDGVAQALRSTLTLQASTLVGRDVRVTADSANFDGTNQLAGEVDLPASTSDLTVHIHDQAGNPVAQVALGSQAGGKIAFDWDGRNTAGEAQPPGSYRISAVGRVDGASTALPVQLDAKVASVRLAPSGEVLLNLESGAQVSMTDVQQVR